MHTKVITRVRVLAAAASMFIAAPPIEAQSATDGPGQSARLLQATTTRSISVPYLLYLPADSGKAVDPWPVLVYLHGGSLRASRSDIPNALRRL